MLHHTAMRLALIDLLFSWPPHGGACTDLYYTARELQKAGHDVKLFMPRVPGSRERSGAKPNALPFPSETIEARPDRFDAGDIINRIVRAVDTFAPDAVFICDAFFLKPILANALSAYPQIWRYYAYEAMCPRDHRRFLNGARCELDYFSTPNECRACAFAHLGPAIRSGWWNPWAEEYAAARADRSNYYDLLCNALEHANAVIVYNEIQRDLIAPINENVFIVPGGVDLETVGPPKPSPSGEKQVILMTGRCEDPAKGLSTLIDASDRLARDRSDFEIWATFDDSTMDSEHFKAIGWKSHDETLQLYGDASICVVPSLWHEPFGMVAVEAMAAARPVVAADGGGLSGIVDREVTGYLYEAGNAEALANHLARLLDDSDLRDAMGRAGRQRVVENYTWDCIVPAFYPDILERTRS